MDSLAEFRINNDNNNNNEYVASAIDVDVDVERERFAIQSSILKMKLLQAIDRAKKLEQQLMKCEGSQNIENSEDFYRPTKDIETPPKKRSKL
jgi:hypothetical protein